MPQSNPRQSMAKSRHSPFAGADFTCSGHLLGFRGAAQTPNRKYKRLCSNGMTPFQSLVYLGISPLKTQVDLRQTPNQPLETRDGRISTKTNEKDPLRWNECRGSRGADGSRNRDLFDANEALYQLSYSPLDVTLLRKATRNNIVRSAVKRNLTPKCRTRVDTVTFRCRRSGRRRRSIAPAVCRRNSSN